MENAGFQVTNNDCTTYEGGREKKEIRKNESWQVTLKHSTMHEGREQNKSNNSICQVALNDCTIHEGQKKRVITIIRKTVNFF